MAAERAAKKKAKASGSKDKARRVEVFDLSEGDDEMMVIDELMEWYLGEDVERVRMVNDQGYERDWYEPVDCLDSGADCHVLPPNELPELRMMITDAQGNAIRTTETRANITFELQKENGRTLKVIDSCVFGEVTQQLFAVGKLWKTGWGMEPYSSEKAFLVKGNSRIPISFHRNSTMTEVRIYRAEAQPAPVASAIRVVNRVEMKECLDREKWTGGWFFLPDGIPARFDWSMKTTYDPTEEGMEFPYRTVFYGPCNGDEIVWSEIEMFSRAEEWQGFAVMEFEKVEDVVITIMERAPQEVSWYIHQQKKESKKKPQEEASSSSGDKKDKMEVDVQDKLESRLPTIGEDEFEEKMIVGGVELASESSLKELKQACKFLGVGVTGRKQLLWQRLKIDARPAGSGLFTFETPFTASPEELLDRASLFLGNVFETAQRQEGMQCLFNDVPWALPLKKQFANGDVFSCRPALEGPGLPLLGPGGNRHTLQRRREAPYFEVLRARLHTGCRQSQLPHECKSMACFPVHVPGQDILGVLPSGRRSVIAQDCI